MSAIEPTRGEGWGDRVRFEGGADGFAYRPDEVIVGGDRARDLALRLPGVRADAEPVFADDWGREAGKSELFLLRGELDPIDVVAELRDEGMIAQPNHVLFAHCACGCACGPHPAERCGAGIAGSPVYASPVYASPVYASPVYASPVYASPVYASPVYASELQATGRRRSSARPADPPARLQSSASASQRTPRVVVLDTGLAAETLRPAALAGVQCAPADCDEPDEDGDHYLDPAAGHGTFIAGLIELLAPGCELSVERVLTTYGDGDEVAIARRITALDAGVELLNLSFGGYAMERMYVLAAALRRVQRRGTVVVASAGNDGTCRPTYPAALPRVVGVGAVGPSGPARFSNYGPWVRACAPGVDLVSAFYSKFDGAETAPPGGTDPDAFRDWARWSGSSFSAPVVVAALAREMRLTGASAEQAVARVVDAPGLLRIPDLGTVVNLQ